MSDAFYHSPILNSPYELPDRHWQLTPNGQPTDAVQQGRRKVDFVSAVPRPKRRGRGAQAELALADEDAATGDRYQTSQTIEAIRRLVAEWRRLPEARWNVTPETTRLLRHWRRPRREWTGRCPFFCQVEAAEAVIWLTEVAPNTATGKRLLPQLAAASYEANPGLDRWALKLATGAGKTTVMAMLIAWQTVNAVRRPTSTRFTKGFLLVAPGITIRDRLRVLLPSDPDNYYEAFDLVPEDLVRELGEARIVVTNFHAFKLRETVSLASGTRALLNGNDGHDVATAETPGQMLQRVCGELTGLRGVWVLNDEAHHCYRERPEPDEEGVTETQLKGDDLQQAKQDNEYARLWISGLEYAQEKLGVRRVIDLSATPFFLRGSGYREGTIFPWTVTEFGLMDAIECGIVKLPRVPIVDNIPSADIPQYRKLWEHIGKDMPKGRRSNKDLADPSKLPLKLQTAISALYGHYAQTFDKWEANFVKSSPYADLAEDFVPPCFIVVCNNTATSKLVFDYLSGYETEGGEVRPAACDLFANYDQHGRRLAKPRTLLIDSQQLESGEALDKDFKDAFADEIDRFKVEKVQREGQQIALAGLTDEDILREVLNTVGKRGRLGQYIRCVVSVSMLTEGWDANTVTHVLGVRAFGTQLLCEQVMGRALRRYSYDINPATGHFDAEYADIFGIPFDFTAEPTVAPPSAPRPRTRVQAVREREHLEITFPRVEGYRVERTLPVVEAHFTEDDRYVLTPDIVGATEVRNSGIVGETADMNLEHLKDKRPSTIVKQLTGEVLLAYYADADGRPRQEYFGSVRRIAKQWLGQYLECRGGTYPAQLLYRALAREAAERVNNAILRAATDGELPEGDAHVQPILDAYNSLGSTRFVGFSTTKPCYATDADKCHIDHVAEDSGWEGQLARVLEAHPQVLRYVKNQGLGFEIPYTFQGERHRYVPDFIVALDDGHGPDDPLYLIAEVKGRRDEQVRKKHSTVRTQWLPAVNGTGNFGRWTFAEFDEPFGMDERLEEVLAESVERMVAEGVRGALSLKQAV